jgi:hypothetical protein
MSPSAGICGERGAETREGEIRYKAFRDQQDRWREEDNAEPPIMWE